MKRGLSVQDCPRLWRMLKEQDSPSWIKNQKTSKLRFLRLLKKIRRLVK